MSMSRCRGATASFDTKSTRPPIRAIDEFKGYVGGNRRGVPNFARAQAAGQPLYYV